MFLQSFYKSKSNLEKQMDQHILASLKAGGINLSETAKQLETKLGYRFKNRNLLFKALCHRSVLTRIKSQLKKDENTSSLYSEEQLKNQWTNERLEFLGDSVLSLVLSHELFELYPDAPEGDLSKIRSSLVNERALSQLSRQHELSQFIFLGKQESSRQHQDRDSIIADAIEAIIGAIYLDGGFERAKKIVLHLFANIFDEDGYSPLGDEDYKTLLQELTQKHFRLLPQYAITGEKGQAHNRKFIVSIQLDSHLLAVGEGSSKKRASQHAAEKAFTKLQAKISSSKHNNPEDLLRALTEKGALS
jgi:ribonuclease-3